MPKFEAPPPVPEIRPKRKTIELGAEDIEVIGEKNKGDIESAILSYTEEEAQGRPIRPGETFDPEAELEKLWNLHGKEGAAALKKYKEKLAFQKEGLAMMQADLIRAIEENPDLSMDEAEKIVGEFTKDYGLTEGQGRIAARIFGTYKRKHAAVEKIFSEHPDPKNLFKTVFGAEPKGEIEVIKSPMTLYFRCHDSEDYARICLQPKLMEEGDRPLTEEETKKGKGSRGVSITVARLPGLEGTLIAENAKGRPYDEKAEATHIHEKQHAMNGLVMEAVETLSPIDPGKIGEDENKFTEELKKRIEIRKACFEEAAKNEILAYMKAGHLSRESGEITEKIMEKLLKKKESGGFYDYFSEDRNVVLGRQVDQYAETVLLPKERIEKIAEKLLDEIYDEKKYEQMIKKGMDAFVKLWRGFKEGNEDAHYKDKIIAFLAREPLRKWLKAARRLIEARGKKEPDFTEQEERWFRKEQ